MIKEIPTIHLDLLHRFIHLCIHWSLTINYYPKMNDIEKEDNQIVLNDNSTIDFHHHDDDHHRVHSNCLQSIRSFLIKLFPIFSWLPYCFPTIINDVIAGIYIGLYQIPQCNL